MNDVAELDRQLRALILTATDLIEQEVRLLHKVAEAIVERSQASVLFSDRFGHLIEAEPLQYQDPPPYRTDSQAAYDRLADELTRAIGGQR